MLQRFFLPLIFILFLSAGAAADPPVLIDAGHGGADQGLVGGKMGLREKDITLLLAKSVSAALRKNGVDVSLLREADTKMDLGARVAAISDREISALLSLHVSVNEDFNICVFKTGQGAKEYMVSTRNGRFYDAGKALAAALADSLKEVFPASRVNLLEMPLPVLGAAGAPAALLETPHPDAFAYQDESVKELLSAAIANGVIRYKNEKH